MTVTRGLGIRTGRPRCSPESRPGHRRATAALSGTRPSAWPGAATWHYLFGLVAATGLRIGEARALTLTAASSAMQVRQVPDGCPHPTTRDALNRYRGAAQRDHPGRASVRAWHSPASKPDPCVSSVPRTGRESTRRDTRALAAPPAAFQGRCPALDPGGSGHGGHMLGARHLPRPRQCLRKHTGTWTHQPRVLMHGIAEAANRHTRTEVPMTDQSLPTSRRLAASLALLNERHFSRHTVKSYTGASELLVLDAAEQTNWRTGPCRPREDRGLHDGAPGAPSSSLWS